MSRFVSLLAIVLTVGLSALHAQSSSSGDVVGTWSGTYSGDASGKYTMVFSRDAAKKIGGTVAATADAGNGYTATFKSVVVDGKTVKMAYDDQENDVMEDQLEATVDDDWMTRTWNSVDNNTKSDTANETFKK